MKLGNFLSKERRTLQWVADATGVTRQAVHNWVNERRIPDRDRRETIIDITDGAVDHVDFIPATMETSQDEIDEIERELRDALNGTVELDTPMMESVLLDLKQMQRINEIVMDRSDED